MHPSFLPLALAFVSCIISTRMSSRRAKYRIVKSLNAILAMPLRGSLTTGSELKRQSSPCHQASWSRVQTEQVTGPVFPLVFKHAVPGNRLGTDLMAALGMGTPP